MVSALYISFNALTLIVRWKNHVPLIPRFFLKQVKVETRWLMGNRQTQVYLENKQFNVVRRQSWMNYNQAQHSFLFFF